MRLIGIGSTTIGVHDWRQADTASIARNYHQNGYRFLYPQIDWGGSTPGYVETEFPIYEYAVALLYGLFGEREFLGRLLSVSFSLLTILFLYLLIRKHADERTALWSCFFWSFLPLNIYYSRTIQPEALLLLCSVAGVYYFSVWSDSGRHRHLLLSMVLVAMACLVKLPALYLGLPLLGLVLSRRGAGALGDWRLWGFAGFVFLAVILWYSHAHQLKLAYGNTFGIWEYGDDKWGNWNLVFGLAYWKKLIHEWLINKHFAAAGIVLFLPGFFQKPWSRSETVFRYWLAALAVFFVLVSRGNMLHEYYQLPFMLPAVYFMGKASAVHFRVESRRSYRVLLSVCFVVMLLVSARITSKYFAREDPGSSSNLQVARWVEKSTEPGSLIVKAGRDYNPAVFYLSRRKGWAALWDDLDRPYVERMRRQGARYVVEDLRARPAPGRDKEKRDRTKDLLKGLGEVVVENGDVLIVEMNAAPTGAGKKAGQEISHTADKGAGG